MKADNAETTEVGIFLNDHGVSKMEYYLTTSVAVDGHVDARTVTTSITMTNSVDRDDLTYTIGSLRAPAYGAPTSSMLLDVLYFAPPGATIDAVEPSRGDLPSLSRAGTEGGRTAQSITMVLDRGETLSVSYTSKLPEGDLGPMSVRHTPTTSADAGHHLARVCDADGRACPVVRWVAIFSRRRPARCAGSAAPAVIDRRPSCRTVGRERRPVAGESSRTRPLPRGCPRPSADRTATRPTPSCTDSPAPPTRFAMTGVPAAMASTATIPKSSMGGNTKMRARSMRA